MYLKIEHELVQFLPPERTARPLPRKDRVPIRIDRIVKPNRHHPGDYRRIGPLLKRVPVRFIAPLLLVPELVRQYWPYPSPVMVPPPGYRRVRTCNGKKDRAGSYPSHVSNCLNGQATTDYPVASYVWPTAHPRTVFLGHSASGGARMNHREVWHSISGRVRGGAPATFFPGHMIPQTDPNTLRFAPSDVPMRDPVPELAPMEPGLQPWQWSNIRPGEPAPRPHSSHPPPRGAKDNKNLTKAAKIGILGFKILDTVSESTEIVAALYKALPEDIRKKANCGKGINIGQYGSAANVCMVNALYDNFASMNTEEAFINIATMVAEDMTIGAFHKLMSKLYPPGISFQRTIVTHALSKLEMELYIVEQLAKLWELWGIRPPKEKKG